MTSQETKKTLSKNGISGDLESVKNVLALQKQVKELLTCPVPTTEQKNYLKRLFQQAQRFENKISCEKGALINHFERTVYIQNQTPALKTVPLTANDLT